MSSTGLPTNAIMRILWFLPCLCFSANYRERKTLWTENMHLCEYFESLTACSVFILYHYRGEALRVGLILKFSLVLNKHLFICTAVNVPGLSICPNVPKIHFTHHNSFPAPGFLEEEQEKTRCVMKVTDSHVPPWCRCRSWCFHEAAQHAAWTVSCPCLESVWSAPHSCCTGTQRLCYYINIF